MARGQSKVAAAAKAIVRDDFGSVAVGLREVERGRRVEERELYTSGVEQRKGHGTKKRERDI